MRTPRQLAAAAVAACLPLTPGIAMANGGDSILPRWLDTVRHLSSDDMRGRNTGSPEHRRAAEFVAAQFAALGLEPAGTDGWFQPVEFVARTVRESECSLELVVGERSERLVLGEDATLSMGVESAEQLEAPLVFVGYGISVPDQDYDDLRDVDLRGKIAVYIQGGPSAVSEPRRSHAQFSGERWRHLRAAGAIGLIGIPNPRRSDIPWLRGAANRFEPGMSLADTALDERAGQRIAVNFNPGRAQKLFAGAEHSFAKLLALADSQRALPRFALRPRLRARVRYDREVLRSDNVVALLPGSDVERRHEVVVLTGHLDHLGVATPVNGDSIYNGAMDNATGIATLIEVARRFASSERPAAPRSVLIVAVTGEEKGLLGSHYFASRPTVNGTIVANVNVDMVLSIVPFTHVVVHGVNESELGDTARAVAASLGIQVLPDPRPERNLFIRSDQFNFIRKGIPALAFSAAAPQGSAHDDSLLAWIRTRYHQPSDGPDQELAPGAPDAQVRFATLLISKIANADRRPRWHEKSFFRRFAEQESRP